ncbi:MAG: hypothetical protein KC964_08085 [Candidatus Omnitrophica bacterium]|nr:hypothetical protein [Candidatus Omnitrophota bacterium]
MTSLSEAWMQNATAMLWQSTLVMIAVWLLYALSWKRSAAFRYALLCLILLKFLLPTSLHSITGLGHWLGGVESQIVSSSAPPTTERFNPETANVSPTQATAPTGQSMATTQSMDVALAPAKTHWPSVLFSTWLCGVFLLSLLLVIHALRIRRRFSHAERVTNPRILQLLDDCHQRIGLSKRIALYQLPGLSSPVLAGLFRPRILVAPETLQNLTDTHLRPIFLHELTHAKRRDLWVNTLQIILQVLWFIHPGLWLTNWMIRRERERACDDLVLTKMEGEGRDYADSIMEVLKGTTEQRLTTVGLLGIAERGEAIKGRILRILDTERRFEVRIGTIEYLAMAVAAILILPLGTVEKGFAFSSDKEELI